MDLTKIQGIFGKLLSWMRRRAKVWHY